MALQALIVGVRTNIRCRRNYYVRAKVTCGTDEAFTSNIPTNWVYNYGGTDANGTTSDITASLSGSPSSISNGGDMRIDQTVTWTKPSTSFETSTFRWSTNGIMTATGLIGHLRTLILGVTM